MTKIAEVHVDCCRECPFSDSNRNEKEITWGKTWCEHLDKEVSSISIDEDCPLENT